MLKAIVFLITFSFITSSGVSAKSDGCIPENYAFSPGEEVEYSVYYNWGFIWVNAGRVTFNVYERLYRNRPVYHFDSYGTSHRKYDWIFKVRDRFQSYVDKETFRPLWHEMDTYEGGFEARDEFRFIPEENLVITITENSDKPRQIDTLEIEPCSYDVLTAIYVARNLDFAGYPVNEPIPFSILIGNELHELSPRYLGKETIETREKQTFDCIKFSVELVEGFIFTAGNEMFVWVTDDENRIPVLIEAQIRIGSVKAMLHSYSGLRNPETARTE